VTIHHNQEFDPATESILQAAVEIIKSSELYTADFKVDLCMNDGSRFPNFHPFAGGLAYAFGDKAVFYNAVPNFSQNTAQNKSLPADRLGEKANLTWLLAHEFTHNLQFSWDLLFPMKYEFWQQEGYAEYISRQWKNDGLLLEKIQILLQEEAKPHEEFPAVFFNKDGTTQLLSYYKYGLMIQYLFEEEGMDFEKLKEEERSFEEIYRLMLEWSRKE
ncbi:MAG: collagenase, partial [Bacteroidota bacterium]